MPAVVDSATGGISFVPPTPVPKGGSSGGGGGGSTSVPPRKRHCFEWGGKLWGQDYPGWAAFRSWLQSHGADPNDWIDNHPAAARCIGARKLESCFEWGGERWGKDYPGWAAFRAWLINHGGSPQRWVLDHSAAARCIGAPPPSQLPPPVPPVIPPPGGTSPGAPPTGTAPPTVAPPGGAPGALPGTVPTPAYNQDTGPYTGRGVFTSDKPLSALQLLGGITWVAVRPEFATPADVQKLRDAGLTVVVWQDAATEAGVAFAKQYADGYIAQAEGPGQLQAAENVTAQLGDFPKALVTNNFMDAYPPGWIAMPEAYTGDNPNTTIANVVGDSLARGAKTVVPIAGTFDGKQGRYPSTRYIADATAQGLDSYGAFAVEDMNANDLSAWEGRLPLSPLPSDTPGTGFSDSTYGVDISVPGAAAIHHIQLVYPEPDLPGESYSNVHDTAGLAGFPAIDFYASAGTPVLAPEAGKILSDTSQYRRPHFIPWDLQKRVGGWTEYLQGESGTVYFITHLDGYHEPDKVKLGQQIGTVAAVPHGWWADHTHIGAHGPVSIEAIAKAPKLQPGTVVSGPTPQTHQPGTYPTLSSTWEALMHEGRIKTPQRASNIRTHAGQLGNAVR